MADGLNLAQRFRIVGRMLQVQPSADVLAAFAETCPEYGTPDVDGVSQDNVRLFVGLGAPLAPPWESTWASDARLLFQRETLDVRYWYRSAGLRAAWLHREPDDHIGLELEFIGLLLERGMEKTAAAFAREHPRAWAARWADAVRAHAHDAFYPQLADEAVRLLEGLSA